MGRRDIAPYEVIEPWDINNRTRIRMNGREYTILVRYYADLKRFVAADDKSDVTEPRQKFTSVLRDLSWLHGRPPAADDSKPLAWRDFLTDDERQEIARAEAAKAEWLRLNASRAGIQNRAIQRAKDANDRARRAALGIGGEE